MVALQFSDRQLDRHLDELLVFGVIPADFCGILPNMSLKPTLLLVHGAWHTPECWARVIPLMEAQHYKCVSVGLPSVNSNPHKRLEDDIQAVRTAIQFETSQGNDVVLVVHSYGGAVSSRPSKASRSLSRMLRGS